MIPSQNQDQPPTKINLSDCLAGTNVVGEPATIGCMDLLQNAAAGVANGRAGGATRGGQGTIDPKTALAFLLAAYAAYQALGSNLLPALKPRTRWDDGNQRRWDRQWDNRVRERVEAGNRALERAIAGIESPEGPPSGGGGGKPPLGKAGVVLLVFGAVGVTIFLMTGGELDSPKLPPRIELPHSNTVPVPGPPCTSTCMRPTVTGPGDPSP
jgi:hypothetical protein